MGIYQPFQTYLDMSICSWPKNWESCCQEVIADRGRPPLVEEGKRFSLEKEVSIPGGEGTIVTRDCSRDQRNALSNLWE